MSATAASSCSGDILLLDRLIPPEGTAEPDIKTGDLFLAIVQGLFMEPVFQLLDAEIIPRMTHLVAGFPSRWILLRQCR